MKKCKYVQKGVNREDIFDHLIKLSAYIMQSDWVTADDNAVIISICNHNPEIICRLHTNDTLSVLIAH